MSNRLIQRAHVATHEEYVLHFERRDFPGSGYSFECDATGKLIHKEMSECGLHSLGYCIEHPELYWPAQIQTFTNRHWEPAIVKCDCGRANVSIFVTPGVYNYGQCDDCGAAYNMSGQRLTDPDTWGPDGDGDDPPPCSGRMG